MKQPKKLTRDQKEILRKYELRPDEWMLIEETKNYLRIIKKDRTETRYVDKEKR